MKLKVQHPNAGIRGYELADEATGLNQVADGLSEEDATRLAACWNAFDGIPTEHIQSSTTWVSKVLGIRVENGLVIVTPRSKVSASELTQDLLITVENLKRKT